MCNPSPPSLLDFTMDSSLTELVIIGVLIVLSLKFNYFVRRQMEVGSETSSYTRYI